MIAAPSNSGADRLAVLLLESGVFKNEKDCEMVRLFGFNILTKADKKIPDRLLPYSARVDNEFQEEEEECDDCNIENPTKRKLTCERLQEYRILISTCTLLGSITRKIEHKYSHVIIDEAGQCTEPEALLPLTFLQKSLGQIVLAGEYTMHLFCFLNVNNLLFFIFF